MLDTNVELKNKTILVTGAAGFIGANLVMELLRSVEGVHVVGLDSMNDYYDVSLKEYRLSQIQRLAQEKPQAKWEFVQGNLADKAMLDQLFAQYGFHVVVNLAAQAGVRYSIEYRKQSSARCPVIKGGNIPDALRTCRSIRWRCS